MRIQFLITGCLLFYVVSLTVHTNPMWLVISAWGLMIVNFYMLGVKIEKAIKNEQQHEKKEPIGHSPDSDLIFNSENKEK